MMYFGKFKVVTDGITPIGRSNLDCCIAFSTCEQLQKFLKREITLYYVSIVAMELIAMFGMWGFFMYDDFAFLWCLPRSLYAVFCVLGTIYAGISHCSIDAEIVWDMTGHWVNMKSGATNIPDIDRIPIKEGA